MYVPALKRFFSISYIVLSIARPYILLAASEIIDLLLQLLDLPCLPLTEPDLLRECLLPLLQLLLLLLDLVIQGLILLTAPG
jgi:hypothetical protein